MDLNQYVIDATRTESVYEKVRADPQLLGGAIFLMVSAGNILDQIKKNVFYEKPIDVEKMKEQFMGCIEGMDLLARTQEHIGSEDAKIELDVNPRIFHSIVGIATETTELLEALDLTSEDVDVTNILEEFGDLNWYQAIGIDAVGGNFEQVLNTNINKLKLRYPEKFTGEDAINRNLEDERTLLDNELDS